MLSAFKTFERKKKRHAWAPWKILKLFSLFKPLVSFVVFFKTFLMFKKKEKPWARERLKTLFYSLKHWFVVLFFSKTFSSMLRTKTRTDAQAKFKKTLFIVCLFQKTRRETLCLVFANKKQIMQNQKKGKCWKKKQSVYCTVVVENKELTKTFFCDVTQLLVKTFFCVPL